LLYSVERINMTSSPWRVTPPGAEWQRNAPANHAFAGVPPQSLDSDSWTHTLVWVLRAGPVHVARQQVELKIRKIEQLAITDAQRRRDGFVTA
jgi:hypothetical protein